MFLNLFILYSFFSKLWTDCEAAKHEAIHHHAHISTALPRCQTALSDGNWSGYIALSKTRRHFTSTWELLLYNTNKVSEVKSVFLCMVSDDFGESTDWFHVAKSGLSKPTKHHYQSKCTLYLEYFHLFDRLHWQKLQFVICLDQMLQPWSQNNRNKVSEAGLWAKMTVSVDQVSTQRTLWLILTFSGLNLVVAPFTAVHHLASCWTYKLLQMHWLWISTSADLHCFRMAPKGST